MRTRWLRPIFFEDEELRKLPAGARLLLAGLWCLADRDGRLRDRVLSICCEIYSSSHNSERSVSRWLCQLCPKWITRYTAADGTKVIQVNNFGRYQKIHPDERSSTIPPDPTEILLRITDSCVPSSLVPDARVPPDCRAASPLGPSIAAPSDDSGRSSDASLSASTRANALSLSPEDQALAEAKRQQARNARTPLDGEHKETPHTVRELAAAKAMLQ